MLSRTLHLGLAGLLTASNTVLAHDHHDLDTTAIDFTTTVTIYSCTSKVGTCKEGGEVAVTATSVSTAPFVPVTVTSNSQTIPTISFIVSPLPVTYPTIIIPIAGPTPDVSSILSISTASLSGAVASYIPVPTAASNSVLAAPTLPDTFTSILVATGSPTLSAVGTSTFTSVQVVRASSTSPGASALPAPSAAAGGRLLVNSAALLGLAAGVACVFG